MRADTIPPKLTGKQLEERLLERARKLAESGSLHMGRYGVQCNIIDGEIKPQKSLPDFEGVIAPHGRQFIIEAKVCSEASFPIANNTHFQERQLRHLLARSRCGALAWLLIHFNFRKLATRTDEAFTVGLEVSAAFPLIRDVLDGGTKGITRDMARMYGVEVPWNCLPGERTPRPDVRALLGEGA